MFAHSEERRDPRYELASSRFAITRAMTRSPSNSGLPDLDQPGFLDGIIVRRERQIVNTRRGDNHSVSRITVEACREIIDGDNRFGTQRQDVHYIGPARAPEPGRKRNREIYPLLVMEHLRFPQTNGG